VCGERDVTIIIIFICTYTASRENYVRVYRLGFNFEYNVMYNGVYLVLIKGCSSTNQIYNQNYYF